MIKYIFYEDYETGKTRETVGRTITQTDIEIYAGQTGDFSPCHMDETWCKNAGFKERIAHETLIFSIGMGMSDEIVNPAAFTYGYKYIKFLKPVFMDDTIKVNITTLEKKYHETIENKGIVTEKIEIKNQNDETVMVCEHILLCDTKYQNMRKVK